jgi:hypothetical protein
MKSFLTIALLMSFTSAFAEPLARSKSKTNNVSIKQKLVALYKKEAKKAGSPLAKLIAKVKKENDFPELGSLSDPTVNDIFMISSGKGGASSHGQSFLIGIPAFRKGTGLIEDYGSYIEGYAVLDMMVDSETVILDREVEIVDKK